MTRPDRAGDARGLLAEVLLLEKQEAAAWEAVREGLKLGGPSPILRRAHARLLLRQNQLEAAMEELQAARAAAPDDPEAKVLFASALMGRGEFAQAAALLDAVLAARPDLAAAHSVRAAIRLRQGQADAALADAERAAALRPHLAAGWRLVGSIRLQRRELDAAIAAVTRAAQCDPDDPDYLVNLAELHRERGDAEAAKTWLDRARAMQEASPTARNLNLQAAGLLDLERREDAAEAAMRSLEVEDTPDGRKLFVAAVKALRPTTAQPRLGHFLTRALAEPWGRPATVVRTALALVRLDPRIDQAIGRAAAAWPRRPDAETLHGEALAALDADPLLLEILAGAPVKDEELEKFLTCARAALLGAAEDGRPDPAPAFHLALARQAYANEFVWGLEPDEAEAARALGERLATTLGAGGRPAVKALLAAAAYGLLQALPWSDATLAGWPEPVAALLDEQVLAPRREAAGSIPRLTPIDDAVSRLVQDQYEANPYPRWMRLQVMQEPLPVNRAAQVLLPRARIDHIPGGEHPQILVAGCGTGQHSISVANRFLSAQVLAVDLSRASLAYARRKTEEAGIQGIEYAQADILRLGELGRAFDVVEASGVLHHMADPEAGASVLVSLLRPGGILGLGLYSATARRILEPARRMAAEQGFDASADGIRAFRQAVLAAAPGDPVRHPLSLGDFFTTSTCRDLMFHVQEHPFEIPRIKAMLQAHGLRFLGFFLEPEVLNAYRRAFPQDLAGVDLDAWAAFKASNPHTFLGMYQFWAQKPA